MRLHTLLIAIIIAVLFFTTATYAEEVKKDFDIRQFLTHTTDRFVITKLGAVVDNQITSNFFITPQNETTSLLANYKIFNNATQQTTTDDKFTIEFNQDDENQGLVKLGEAVAFKFGFQMVNHVAISTGTYNQQGDKYQWIIPTHDRWVFTVYAPNGDIKEVFVAKKLFVEQEKTFLQSYGTYMMMFGLMALNVWVQSKTKNMQQRQAEEAARTVAGTNDNDEFVDGGKKKKDDKKKPAAAQQPAQTKTAKSKKDD